MLVSFPSPSDRRFASFQSATSTYMDFSPLGVFEKLISLKNISFKLVDL